MGDACGPSGQCGEGGAHCDRGQVHASLRFVHLGVEGGRRWSGSRIGGEARGVRHRRQACHRLGGGHRPGGPHQGHRPCEVPVGVGPSVRGGRHSGSWGLRRSRNRGHGQGGVVCACAEKAVSGHLSGTASGGNQLCKVGVGRASDGRDVCEMEDANSQEFSKTTTHPVVVSMPEHNVEQKGGTMRLGERVSIFKDSAASNSIMYKLYGGRKRKWKGARSAVEILERHRHRFEVNPEMVPLLESQGLNFVATCPNNERMEVLEMSRRDGEME